MNEDINTTDNIDISALLNDPVATTSATTSPPDNAQPVKRTRNIANIIKANKNRGLTRKQKAFVQYLVEHPKESNAAAAKHAYNVTDTTLASVMANENLKKPKIISELAKYNTLVEDTITGVISDWGDSDNSRKREIAIESAKWVHDKIHGKATQRIQQQTEIVQISMNLTGDNETPPEDL